MSMKLKVLGLGLLAVMATSAFAVMNATAETGGHFVNDAPNGHATIVGVESGEHRLHLSGPTEGIVGCEIATYHGTTTNATETQLDITPTYKNCGTTPNTDESVKVTTNGCKYRFTVGNGGTFGTADLVGCTTPLEIHHPNCTITVAPQNNLSSVHYTRVTESGKHAITLDVNVEFATQYHGGICIFLGTNQKGRLSGSVTVSGRDTENNAVNITAT
jgi:hypothetical protein